MHFPSFARGGAVLFTLLLAACAAERGEPASEATAAESATPGTPGLALSIHTTLGIPEAASVADDPKHVLLVKPQYVVSYDSTRKNPRWTSWELTEKWVGMTPRSPSFRHDPGLASTFPQATETDYTSSGFQRGHLCPSKDRTDSVANNQATFVFTNAVPQTPNSNTDTWETLEEDERNLAKAGSHLFIVAGSRYETEQTIGQGVSVPTSMFKVVVVMNGDTVGPNDVTATTRVIAVDIPNTTGVKGSYKGFRTSFGSLETLTGLRFLSDVPTEVHDALAKVVDAE